MNHTLRTPWSRLAAAARLAPADARDASAPRGFATRVAALAFAAGRRGESPVAALVVRFSWRALAVAGLVTAASAAANFKPFVASLSASQDAANAATDPVGELLNIS